MGEYWMWWIVAILLAGAELVTGTFYLLAIAVAFAIGGIAALFGASIALQWLVAGVLALVGTSVAHYWRTRRGEPPPQPELDVGARVRVETWHDDGTARVLYRGTHWDAVLASNATPRRSTMYIVATRGSTLVLGAEQPGEPVAL
jgi:membrane protein implicated in regulation of membrane protease activity